jgi:serine-type D-Ala-D-Ala carboxypeptidase
MQSSMTSASTPIPAADAEARFAAAERVLQKGISARAFPGCAFGVFARGEVVWEGAAGRSTFEPNSPAVTSHTVWDVASVTKVAATTAAAMLLFQRGLLDLETPVGELLPGFVVGREPGSAARHVRLRHLLAHNSGLPGYVELFKDHTTPAALLRACLELPLEAPPGTRAEYSDPGFTLLGKAIEVITGEPLPRWVDREILRPLGMASSRFCPPLSMRASIPPTEDDTTFRHRIIQGEVQDENAYVLNGAAGHAGLFSNIPDLLRLAEEMLAAAEAPGCSHAPCLYQHSTVELFSTRQEPEGSSRALGWDTPSEDSTSGRHFSPRSIGHLGFSGCSLWIDLAAGIAVVLLTNRTWPDRKNRLIRQVWPAFHDAVREAL